MQIGWTYLLLPSLEIVYGGEKLIKPIDGKITPELTDLTGISWKSKHWNLAEQVIPYLINLGLGQFPVAAFGKDWKTFNDYCNDYGYKKVFSDHGYDISEMVALFLGFPINIGQTQIMGRLGLPIETPIHRAQNDSINAARILQYLLQSTIKPCFREEWKKEGNKNYLWQ